MAETSPSQVPWTRGKGRARSPRPVVVGRLGALAPAVLLVVSGACSDQERTTPPAPLRATDFVPTPVVPLARIVWPVETPKSELAESIASIERALSLYSEAERHAASEPAKSDRVRRVRASADAAMTEALDRLKRHGGLVAELSPYHLRTVESALMAGEFPAARERLESWLAVHPDDYDHRLELGKVEFQLSRWAESAASLRRAAELRPASIEARYWLAEVCHRMGARDEGIAATREGLDLLGFPAGSLWAHPMGKAFLGNSIKVLHRFRDYQLLAEVAAAYRRREPDAIEAIMAEGVALVHGGSYAAAEPLLRRALGDRANREEVLYTLGLAQAKQGKWTEAAGSFSALLAEEPFFARAYYQLALCLSRLERESQADVLFERSRDLAESERELRREIELEGIGQIGRAAVARSRAYRLRGQYDRAESALRRRELSQSPFAVLALAELYIELLRVPEAARVLAHAGTLIPSNHADLEGNRARLAFARGDEEAAFALFEKVIAQPGEGTVWRMSYARLLIEAGRLDRAIGVLEAVGEEPDSEIRYQLGRALLLAGRPARALEALRGVSPGDKRWTNWHGGLWLAWALAAGGEDRASLEAAEAELDRAAEAERRLHVYLEARRAVLERAGDVSGEVATLRQALSRYEGLLDRARALEREIARSSWPASGPRYLEVARLLAQRGERAEAIRCARLAALAQPGSREPLEALASWLDAPGDAFFRLRVLRDLIERGAGAEARRELGELEAEWLRY